MRPLFSWTKLLLPKIFFEPKRCFFTYIFWGLIFSNTKFFGLTFLLDQTFLGIFFLKKIVWKNGIFKLLVLGTSTKGAQICWKILIKVNIFRLAFKNFNKIWLNFQSLKSCNKHWKLWIKQTPVLFCKYLCNESSDLYRIWNLSS